MTTKHARLSLLVVPLILGACSATGGVATDQPTQPPAAAAQPSAPIGQVVPPTTGTSPSAEPSPSAAASPSDVAEKQPTAGPLDPCSLLSSAEASQAVGVKLGAGKHQIAEPDTICTYAKGSTEVKVFLTAPTDPATAKAYYEAHKSEIPAGAHITELPTFFDGAVIGKGTLPIGTISGIYVLHSTNFFELYCEYPACTDDALKTGAQLIAGRLP